MRDAGMIQRELADLLAGLLRPVEPLGGAADFVLREGHGALANKGMREDD